MITIWRLKSDIFPKSTPKSLKSLFETSSLPLENSLGTLPDLSFPTIKFLNLLGLTSILFSVNHLVSIYTLRVKISFI